MLQPIAHSVSERAGERARVQARLVARTDAFNAASTRPRGRGGHARESHLRVRGLQRLKGHSLRRDGRNAAFYC